MLNIFIVLHIFSARYLMKNIDENQVKDWKYDVCNFKEAFLVIKASKTFFGEPRIWDMTQMIDGQTGDYDRDAILVGSDDNGYNENVCDSGFEIIKISPEDKFIDFILFYG